MKKDKIKIAMVTNHFGITGIGTVMMNYCKALDKEKFNLTILAGEPIADLYKCECKKNGIQLIALPSRHQKSLAHYAGLWRELRKRKFDIVHVHGSSSMMAIELLIAKLAGIKYRIAHSHSCHCSNMKLQNLLNPIFKRLYTVSIACSEVAGDWLFGKDNYIILPNGFDTKGFVFSEQKRNKIRRELNIGDKFVLGHVGRFNNVKNQRYLLELFNDIAIKGEEIYLLLVGTGPDFDMISKLVENHQFSSRIILYGESEDVVALYSSMDVFLFPSLYEGLGLVAVEAQISGLPCVISDKVPRSVKILENVNFKGIGVDDKKAWIEKIQDYKQLTIDRENIYQNNKKNIQNFDISFCSKTLENIYYNLANR